MDEGERQQREANVVALAELMAHVAHEVNQPLAAIAANGNACLRWLAADPPNIDEARAAAERSVRDARRASDVIAAIRALLSQTLGPREMVSLPEVAGACIARLHARAQRAGVRLSLEAGEALPRVAARPAALRQALEHVIANAIEACTEVEAGKREVRVSLRGPQNGEMVIVVEDTGAGVLPDPPQRMFEPLFTTKPGRLGLGLAVARSMLEQHGGRLLAQRGTDGVTRFTATLPVEVTTP
jgi:signal transduction histidine kinase